MGDVELFGKLTCHLLCAIILRAQTLEAEDGLNLVRWDVPLRVGDGAIAFAEAVFSDFKGGHLGEADAGCGDHTAVSGMGSHAHLPEGREGEDGDEGDLEEDFKESSHYANSFCFLRLC